MESCAPSQRASGLELNERITVSLFFLFFFFFIEKERDRLLNKLCNGIRLRLAGEKNQVLFINAN